MTPRLGSRLAAEAFGTFALVVVGVGSAIYGLVLQTEADLGPVQLGNGVIGVSLAFGLVVTGLIYAVGHQSGAHFNPAVTIGAAVSKRFPWKDVLPYIIVQVVGGLIGGAVLYLIATGLPGFDPVGGMGANGYGEGSPGGYGLVAVIIAEIVFTAIFVLVILGVTHHKAPAGFAGVAIGFTLTAIILALLPISGASLNPARSTAVAFFNGGDSAAQLWVFWVAPIIGGVLAGLTHTLFSGSDREDEEDVVGDNG